MIRSIQALLAAALLLGTFGSAQAAETGTLSLQAPLFKTKAKGDVVKFQPFRSSKDPFLVTVALYDAETGEPLLLEDGVTPWTESFTVTANNAAPSDPANGDLREPAKISGSVSVVLGSTVALPPDLLERQVLFTTRLTLTKKGQELTPFEESPRRPLGLDGAVNGQALAPESVTTEALALTTGAAAGHVLTSDAAGNAAWQPLPDLPGVAGTVNRLAVFDSPDSIGDSNISDTGAQVQVDVPLSVTGAVSGSLDVLAGDDLSAGDDIFAGDDVFAQGDVNATGAMSAGGDVTVGGSVNATGNLTAGGALNGKDLILINDAFVQDLTATTTIRVGSPVSATVENGDIAAVDDLIADDDVLVGDDVIAGGSGLFGGTLTVNGSAAVTGALSTSSSLTASSDVKSTSGAIVTGTPTSTVSAGDIVSTSDVFADVDIVAGDDLISGDDLVVGGHAEVGANPTFSPTDGDMALDDDLLVDDDIFLAGGLIILDDQTGSEQLEIRTDEDMVFQVNNDITGGATDEFRWNQAPPGLGGFVAMRLDKDGDLSIEGNYSSGGADLAEYFPTVDASLSKQPGTLVALDPTRAEHVQRAALGSAEVVLGVVPTAPGMIMGAGSVMGLQPELLRAADRANDEERHELAVELEARWHAVNEARVDRVAVALQGRVPVLVDLTGGTITAGDRLGMSAQAGYAARYTGYGPVIGLAMEGFDGTGSQDSVVVFLGLDHSPDASSSGAYGAASLVDGLAELERARAPFIGQGQLAPGQARVVVEDARLTADSLPVVTFHGDPGGSSWISERGEGWFVLELARPAAAWLDFGFCATP